MYISVSVDRERCRPQLRVFTHAYYGPRFDVDANCAFRLPEVYAARLQRFLDAGVKTVMLGATWPDVEQVRRITHNVVPRLQGCKAISKRSWGAIPVERWGLPEMSGKTERPI